jgi:hypothetical protein
MSPSSELTSSQKIGLWIFAALSGLAILAGGMVTGIWMIVQDKPITEALLVMAVPFVGIILLVAIASAIYSSVARGAEAAHLAVEGLRQRIITFLGIALFIGLVGVLFIAGFGDKDIPGGLLTLVSTIAGGLIGVLVPSAVPVLFPGAAPVVTAISARDGSVAGGTPVTITGTGFEGATAVHIGGSPAGNVTVKSPTEIAAVTPPHAAGTVDVIVTTPRGSSAPTPAARFTYVASPPHGTVPSGAPVVTTINPPSGPVAGSTTVTITGTGLEGATAVHIGGSPAGNVTVKSPTEIAAVTPPHAAGTVDVIVITPRGSSAPTAAARFTYAALSTSP